MKAMTLQHVQADLSRLYRAARERIGDPGDLTALPDANGNGAAEMRPQPVAPGDVREELVRIVNELYATQLITATGGNVSVRVPGRDELWITPSQLFKGDLKPEILVRIDLDGNTLDSGTLAPSSERLMHCAVYRARPLRERVARRILIGARVVSAPREPRPSRATRMSGNRQCSA